MLGRKAGFILILLLATFVCSPPASTTGVASLGAVATPQSAVLVINEYLADPAGSSAGDLAGDANGDGVRSASQDEFVELLNGGSEPLDVGGFTISDATQVRFTFPAGAVVPVGEAVVVFGGGAPTGAFGNAAQNGLVFVASGLNLNNGAESIVVKDNTGAEVARRDYPAADGSANQSLTLDPGGSGTYVRHSMAAGSGGRLFSPGAQVNGDAFTPTPHISQINPQQVLQSDEAFDLEVQGANFDAGATVHIDFAPVATMFINASTLTATVPAAVASSGGAHVVTVFNSNGNRSNSLTLTIIPPPPVLQSLTPAFVETGSGPRTIFLRGANFTPSSQVLVDGAGVATFFINLRELAATMPASFVNSLGARRVKVRNPDGQTSNELAFEVLAKTPRVTALVPSQILAGSPAFTLEVRGANFTADMSVLLSQNLLATKFVSPSLLLADVPAALVAEVGLKPLTVQPNSGTVSNELALRVVAVAPIIGALAPDSAIEGSGEAVIHISGERFQSGARVRVLAGVLTSASTGTLLDVTFVSSERLEARFPAALLQTAGNLLLRVENPDFGFSNEVPFRVLIKDPLVINEYLADPPDGDAGDANGDGSRSSSQDEFVELVNRTDAAMDISGYKLSDAESVRHVFAHGTIIPPFEAVVVFGGGAPQGRFGNASDNALVFEASSGGLSLNNGGDTIKLEDAGGRTVQEIKFGAAEGGANESLNRDPDVDGAVFANHSRVSFGSRFSPGAKAGGEAFTRQPTISALAPTTARVRARDVDLTIRGANFQPGAVVLFGQNVLQTAFHSESELEARLDSEAVTEGGFVDVRVRNPKGELSAVVKFLLTDDPPTVTSITPKKTGTGAENLEVAVTGERFQRSALVTVANETVETRAIQNQGAARTLVAIVPTKFFATSGELPIRVVNADANTSNTMLLIIENGPLITRLSRAKFKAGRGEVEITVSGVAFAPTVTLFVNDVAVPTRFLNETSFTARFPAQMTATPGQLTLQARHPDGGRSNRVKVRIVE